MSRNLGMLVMVVGESPKIAAAIKGKAAFFDPLIGMVPLRGVGPSITNLSNGFDF